MRALKNSRMHRKIMQTRDAFLNEDGFNQEEALGPAIDKRKFRLTVVIQILGKTLTVPLPVIYTVMQVL